MVERLPESATADIALRTLGWRFQPSQVPWLEASALRGTDWALGRVWTAGELTGIEPRLPDTLHAFVGLDGRGTVTVGETPIVVQPGQLLIVNANRGLRISSAMPWARVEWVLRPPLLAFSQSLRAKTLRNLSEAHIQLFAAITNVLVDDSADGQGPREYPPLASFATTLGSILVVAMEDSDRGAAIRAGTDPLWSRAQDLIKARYTDPMFGVRELCRELSLSKSHLHRIFAARGTTPRRELEVQRIDAALAILDVVSASAQTQAYVANVAGFRSPEQMRAALSRRRTRNT